jgi:hypothetical protein
MTFVLLPIFKLLSKIIGKVRLKTYAFISYDTLTDDQEFNDLIKIDPQAGTLISFRGVSSLLTQSKPDILHEAYPKPVLLCIPKDDKMTPVYYMKKTFEKIKGGFRMHFRISPLWWPVLAVAFPVIGPLLLIRNRRFKDNQTRAAKVNQERISQANHLEMPG